LPERLEKIVVWQIQEQVNVLAELLEHRSVEKLHVGIFELGELSSDECDDRFAGQGKHWSAAHYGGSSGQGCAGLQELPPIIEFHVHLLMIGSTI
jgi:hypothetical protein